MAYPGQRGSVDSVAGLNARIGGLRKKIKDRKLAISERCIAKFRTGLVPGGMLLDSETALWCREVIDLEAEIQSLLSRIREVRAAEDEQAEPFYRTEPPPALRFSEQITPPPAPPVIVAPAPKPAPPSPAPRAVVTPAPQAVVIPAPPSPVPQAVVAPAPPPGLKPEQPPAKPVMKRATQPAPPLPTFTPAVDGSAGVVVCRICGLENKKGTRFCQECGAPLASAAPPKPHIQQGPSAKVYCPECGERNEPASKFCGDCGAHLS